MVRALYLHREFRLNNIDEYVERSLNYWKIRKVKK